MTDTPTTRAEEIARIISARAESIRSVWRMAYGRDLDCDPKTGSALEYGRAQGLDMAVEAILALPPEGGEGEALGHFASNAHLIENLKATLAARDAEIAALKADKARMGEALEPFANLGVTSGPDEEPCTIPYRITRGSIRRARSALKEPS